MSAQNDAPPRVATCANGCRCAHAFCLIRIPKARHNDIHTETDRLRQTDRQTQRCTHADRQAESRAETSRDTCRHTQRRTGAHTHTNVRACVPAHEHTHTHNHACHDSCMSGWLKIDCTIPSWPSHLLYLPKAKPGVWCGRGRVGLTFTELAQCLRRARAYVQSGADGVMIHSKARAARAGRTFSVCFLSLRKQG